MIYLVRHGLDDENYIGGWSDATLTNKGIHQIEDTRDFLIKNNILFDKIISSDINRAYTSALIINEFFNKEIIKSQILRELNKGELNGLLKSTVSSRYEEFKGNPEIDVTYPNGESMISFYNRIKDNLDSILKMDNNLLVTHRGVINMLYFILNDIPLSNDKKRFNVTHGSVHELDPIKKTIKRIY